MDLNNDCGAFVPQLDRGEMRRQQVEQFEFQTTVGEFIVCDEGNDEHSESEDSNDERYYKNDYREESTASGEVEDPYE